MATPVSTLAVLRWTLTIAGILTAAGLIVAVNSPPSALELLLILPPHLALGIAWVLWICSATRFESLPASLTFSGLLACTLNIGIFWLGLPAHHPSGTRELAGFLLALGLLTGLFGTGRAQVPVLLAAVTGLLLWIPGGFGIL